MEHILLTMNTHPEDEITSTLEAGMLPDLDFFRPNEKFTTWAKNAIHMRYHQIMDIGAGSGLMTKTLQDLGLAATGFDIIRRPEPHTMIQVLERDMICTLVKKMPESAVMIIARPCHSGFAQQYFKLQLKFCYRLFAYYIGLPRNVEQDLPDMSYEIIETDVGEDGENIYQVYGVKEDMKDLFTLKNRAGVYEWDEDEESYISVRETALMPSGMKAQGEVREAYMGMRGTFQRAPALSNIINEPRSPERDCGWIDPAGHIYLVSYQNHAEFIFDYVFLDTTDGSINDWVKVWPEDTTSTRWCRENFEDPNPAQIRALRKFNIKFKRERIGKLVAPSRKGGY